MCSSVLMGIDTSNAVLQMQQYESINEDAMRTTNAVSHGEMMLVPAATVPTAMGVNESTANKHWQLMCGNTRFSALVCVQLQAKALAHEPLTIGNGMRIVLSPELGPGQLGLAATRTLKPGDWTYFDGLLYIKSGRGEEGLLRDHKTHACAIELSNRTVRMIGVRARTCRDMSQEDWLNEVNRQAHGMGGASWANSSVDDISTSNAGRPSRIS
jgi:hypothetical protein